MTTAIQRYLRCSCDPSTVKIQQYQRTVGVLVPDFIKLRKGWSETEEYYTDVGIDVCLVSEIWELWRKGIRTTGNCCGHNQIFPYIGVVDEDIPKMKALGYEVQPHSTQPEREDSFIPKSLSSLE